MLETSNSPELMSRSMGGSPQGSWLTAPLPAQHGASKVFLTTPLPRGGGRVFWPELGIPHITFVHIPLTVAQSGHGFHLQRNLGTWVPRKGSTGMLVNIIARGSLFGHQIANCPCHHIENTLLSPPRRHGMSHSSPSSSSKPWMARGCSGPFFWSRCGSSWFHLLESMKKKGLSSLPLDTHTQPRMAVQGEETHAQSALAHSNDTLTGRTCEVLCTQWAMSWLDTGSALQGGWGAPLSIVSMAPVLTH